MPNFKNRQDYEYQDKWHDAQHADQRDQSDPLAELESMQSLPKIRNMPGATQSGHRKRHPQHQRKKKDTQIRKELADREPTLTFSYNVSQDSHEYGWLVDSLGAFIHLEWLSDVLRQVKGGKEASVYLCAGTQMTGEAHLAAKIYRPRMFRNLRNDSLYREGRLELDSDGNRILDHGMQRAMEKKTGFGQQLRHISWVEHEYQSMQILHRAGVDMPRPYASGNNAILMEYIGSETLPAPTLNTVNLEADQALVLFQQAIKNLDIMLAHHRVHADFSAYNILYWEDRLWVIDFPQAVHPDENRNAYQLFERDVQRLCDYFAVQGVRRDYKRLTAQIWEKNRGRFRLNVHPGLLDDESDEDRAYWDSLKK
jgi:RIO kinase 1